MFLPQNTFNQIKLMPNLFPTYGSAMITFSYFNLALIFLVIACCLARKRLRVVVEAANIAHQVFDRSHQ